MLVRTGGTAVGDAPLSTVTNAARLLKTFLTDEGPVGVSELSRRLGVGKSAVHRLVTTLAAEGLVEQDPHTGGYRLGIVVLELGRAVPLHRELHTAAAQVLFRVRAQTGGSVQVGVLVGDEVVHVDRLEGPHHPPPGAGSRVPAHRTSCGRVLLAHLDPAEREEYLAHPPIPAPRQPDDLRAGLDRVLRSGWAEVPDEQEGDVASVAAPVRDATGHVVAALAVGAPVSRFGPPERRRVARLVVEAGEAISRRLGWVPETGAGPGDR
ncbi:Transcriptional regulator, IclR family [Pseudonocardia sp. Ae707_Ps1]|nr:Transcriptional regulator, IclR family [Pseudonocardia sp. Ae707_Ps1]